MSSEASNGTSPLDEAVSKVEPEFEVLEKHKKLSSPRFLMNVRKFLMLFLSGIINFLNIYGHYRLK